MKFKIVIYNLPIQCPDCKQTIYKRTHFNDTFTHFECVNCGGEMTHLNINVK